MVQEIYSNDWVLVDEYVECYEHLTGIDIRPWDAKNEPIIVTVIGLVAASIIFMPYIIWAMGGGRFG